MFLSNTMRENVVDPGEHKNRLTFPCADTKKFSRPAPSAIVALDAEPLPAITLATKYVPHYKISVRQSPDRNQEKKPAEALQVRQHTLSITCPPVTNVGMCSVNARVQHRDGGLLCL